MARGCRRASCISRLHTVIKKDDSKCADHCEVFALSYPVDTDFQRVCSHNAVTVYFLKVSVISHKGRCVDCEKLDSVLEVVRGTTSEYTMQLGKVQAEDHLYEAKYAAAKIFE